MKAVNFLFLLIIVFHFPSPGFADSLYSQNESCRCDSSVADPYEEPIQFAAGANKGKCVQSCQYRRSRILNSGHTYSVANVLHNGKFMIAEFDPKGAVGLDILFEEFMTAVSHVAFRIRFKKESPIRLTNQLVAGSEPSETSQDLVISVEAALPVNESFTFNRARLGDFLLNYRLTTIEETKRWMLRVKKHRVRQYQLKVPLEALPNLVALAVQRSQEQSFEKPYYLLTQNCATGIFELLDEATRATPPTGISWAARSWPVAGPLGTLQYLYASGLISKQLSNLESE